MLHRPVDHRLGGGQASTAPSAASPRGRQVRASSAVRNAGVIAAGARLPKRFCVAATLPGTAHLGVGAGIAADRAGVVEERAGVVTVSQL